MYEGFGAVVDGGRVTFQLFLPDNAKDPSQYQRGDSPQIVSVSAPGSYQAQLGDTAWDLATAPELEATDHPSGTLYVSDTFDLPDGFHEYKYYVTFANGARRWCTDPCTRYVGLTDQNSGFVIGGNRVEPVPNVAPREFPDLVIYELMLDDFTAAYRGTRPPVDAVLDKLDYLVELGINTIEFMPWTAWRGDDFDWGYDPYLFFSVENRYIEDPARPLDRLVRLQRLIDTLHKRGIGVIMDGVFDHVNAGQVPDTGFGYFWLYQNPADSPYIGSYAGGGYFQDLDYHNGCTQQFITDVCTYWLDRYQLDGIRFDYVGGIYIPGDRGHGVAKLIPDLRSHLEAQGRDEVALILEDMPDNRYDAIDDTNQVDATGCWYDRMHWDVPAAARAEAVTPVLVRVCNSALDFGVGKGRSPTSRTTTTRRSFRTLGAETTGGESSLPPSRSSPAQEP
jgi:pullulanase